MGRSKAIIAILILLGIFVSISPVSANEVEDLISKLKSEDAEVRAEAVEALGETGDPRAVAPLIEVLLRDPDKEVRKRASEALDRIGERKTEKALGIRIVSDADRKLAKDHFNRGMEMKREGDTKGALSAFQKAVDLDPDHAEAQTQLGFLYYEAGELKRAISAFQQAARVERDSPLAHFNLGSAYLYNGDFELAIKELQEALALEPRSVEAHNNLGLAYAALEKFYEAVREYQEAIEIEPNYVPAYNNLAWLRATAKNERYRNVDEAISLAQTALKLSPNDTAVLDTLAEIYYRRGAFDEAIETIDRAIELAPEREYYRDQKKKFLGAKRKAEGGD
ncbi:MAG: tetratricopeptide repeat protein [bacterium]